MARFGRNFAPMFLPLPHGVPPKAHQYGPLTTDPAAAVASIDASSFFHALHEAQLMDCR
jgi:hypothetical protein